MGDYPCERGACALRAGTRADPGTAADRGCAPSHERGPVIVKSIEDLAVLGVGFVSALVPLVNIEAYLGVRGAVAGMRNIWLLGFAAALGQMLGKLIWYYLGATSLRWRWIRRRVETPKARARLEKWRGRTVERPVVAGALVLLSATSGFPRLPSWLSRRAAANEPRDVLQSRLGRPLGSVLRAAWGR